ncbi:MAG: diguanylate cyclase [Erysipelotrichaceae bacterium]|nr:diguanylate cyclase [Erysipelotrichaceae bacterium]
MGDEYIIPAAKILIEVFAKVGTCYRIGGDVFIIIFENFDLENIDEYFNKVERMQKNIIKNHLL